MNYITLILGHELYCLQGPKKSFKLGWHVSKSSTSASCALRTTKPDASPSSVALVPGASGASLTGRTLIVTTPRPAPCLRADCEPAGYLQITSDVSLPTAVPAH